MEKSKSTQVMSPVQFTNKAFQTTTSNFNIMDQDSKQVAREANLILWNYTLYILIHHITL